MSLRRKGRSRRSLVEWARGKNPFFFFYSIFPPPSFLPYDANPWGQDLGGFQDFAGSFLLFSSMPRDFLYPYRYSTEHGGLVVVIIFIAYLANRISIPIIHRMVSYNPPRYINCHVCFHAHNIHTSVYLLIHPSIIVHRLIFPRSTLSRLSQRHSPSHLI